MFHNLFHFLGDGGEEIGGEFQLCAFTDAIFVSIYFRNNTFQLKRVGFLVDFETNDDNENNDNITENTGFEHMMYQVLCGVFIYNETLILWLLQLDYRTFQNYHLEI